ncbi:MAG TPA: hypothetical protein ENI23_05135 [bacterium]|nr:hypothetical protein [bacterium]
MSNIISGSPQIFDLNPYDETNVQQHKLGAIAVAPNGDAYRYTRIISTGTDLIAGNLQVSLAAEANHQNRVIAANVAAGVSTIEVTVGGTQVDANEYDEGSLVWNDNSPEGEFYTVTSHDASAAGSEDITVNFSPALRTAATTASQVELVRNPWNNPAISQLITERAAGVAVQDWDVSVANFGWLKTRGLASVLMDSTGSTIGFIATISNATNGAVGVIATIAQEVTVGQFLGTPINGEFNTVYLKID